MPRWGTGSRATRHHLAVSSRDFHVLYGAATSYNNTRSHGYAAHIFLRYFLVFALTSLHKNMLYFARAKLVPINGNKKIPLPSIRMPIIKLSLFLAIMVEFELNEVSNE